MRSRQLHWSVRVHQKTKQYLHTHTHTHTIKTLNTHHIFLTPFLPSLAQSKQACVLAPCKPIRPVTVASQHRLYERARPRVSPCPIAVEVKLQQREARAGGTVRFESQKHGDTPGDRQSLTWRTQSPKHLRRPLSSCSVVWPGK